MKRAVDSLIDGTIPNSNSEGQALFNNFLEDNEQFLVLADFSSYIKIQNKLEQAWAQERLWYQMSLVNIAHSERFDVDKTIKRYAKEIWHLNQLKIEKTK